MSGLVTIETAEKPPLRLRLAARCAIGAARLLARCSPGRLQKAMKIARGRAKPSELAQAERARNAVVAVSVRCAGPWCLQRSIATALLCRAGGTWPDWYTGVRTSPFRAHAWVVAEGQPVGEPADWIGLFHSVLVVRARR